MIKNPLNQGILLKKYFGKLLLGLALTAMLLPAGTGTAFASGSLPDEGTAVQQRVVTGTVTEPDGTPLPAVSVREKGTTNGTLTDAQGSYRITVTTSNPVLVFSFVGYATQEINVGSQGTIDIELIPGEVGLDEIVVIGYGTVKKRDLTGSVASISGEVMRDVPSSNISQALQGRISGVDMSQTSTKPGAAMQIRVRGTRSLNASNDPLVVIDGIPFAGSISDINPGYIKSIDVLKDASATAIYGSRGANGVILITTNQGYAGQKAQVSYSSYVGMKNVFSEFPMMNGPEFVALRAARGQYTNGVDESDDQDINWQELFYRTGMVTNHDLGVTGGTANGNYNFSVGYYKDQAVIPGQEYNRFSMRGTLDQQVGKFFRFGFITNNNYSINDGNNMGLYGVLSQSPIVNPYNEDGSWKRVIKMPLDDQWTYSRETVEALGDQWIDRTKAYGSYNTLFGEVKIPGIQGLKYRINLGGNFRMSNGGSYTGEGVFSNNATTPSTATVSNSLTTNWAVENLLTYERTFAGKHQVNAVGMYSAEQTMYNRSQMSAKSIPADAFQYFNLGHASGEKTIDPNSQDYQVSGLMSWMGRAMYSYDNRYMLTATLRADASSRLAPGRKWHTYPAVSAGWNIKNESFMQNVTAIDMLKLRFGYG
jgi:TonB-linked SusC/RagA family outer membrane protein